MILCLIKLMSGSNVPGVDQKEQAVCVRDSIEAESLRATDYHKLYSIQARSVVIFSSTHKYI